MDVEWRYLGANSIEKPAATAQTSDKRVDIRVFTGVAAMVGTLLYSIYLIFIILRNPLNKHLINYEFNIRLNRFVMILYTSLVVLKSFKLKAVI